MIREGEQIRIVWSEALSEMKLTPLIGRTGMVTCLLATKRNPGCMVHFREKYLGEKNWFIPIASIETSSQVEKKRKVDMISNVKL